MAFRYDLSHMRKNPNKCPCHVQRGLRSKCWSEYGHLGMIYRICAKPPINANAMSSGARGLNVGLSIYIHSLCIPAANALANLRICADLPEPCLLVKRLVPKSHMLAQLYFKRKHW